MRGVMQAVAQGDQGRSGAFGEGGGGGDAASIIALRPMADAEEHIAEATGGEAREHGGERVVRFVINHDIEASGRPADGVVEIKMAGALGRAAASER